MHKVLISNKQKHKYEWNEKVLGKICQILFFYVTTIIELFSVWALFATIQKKNTFFAQIFVKKFRFIASFSCFCSNLLFFFFFSKRKIFFFLNKNFIVIIKGICSRFFAFHCVHFDLMIWVLLWLHVFMLSLLKCLIKVIRNGKFSFPVRIYYYCWVEIYEIKGKIIRTIYLK